MFIGLDLSLTATGIAILDKNKKLIHSESLETPKKKIDGMDRYIFIRNRVTELVKKYKIKQAWIEGYSFGSRGRSIFNLGELGGIIRITLYELNIPFIEIPPKQVKKHISGSGNASKIEVMEAIKEKYGIEFTDDNSADAFAIVHSGLDMAA